MSVSDRAGGPGQPWSGKDHSRDRMIASETAGVQLRLPMFGLLGQRVSVSGGVPVAGPVPHTACAVVHAGSRHGGLGG